MQDSNQPSRRSFLQRTAIAGAAATPLLNYSAQAPAVVAANKTVLHVQSAYPEKEYQTTMGHVFAQRVSDISGGELEIVIEPLGKYAGTFDLAKAVSDGKVDGGHTFPGYHHGVNAAFSLWATSPAYGMTSTMLRAWHQEGDGSKLLAQVYKSSGLDIHSMLFVPLPSQPLGWFKKEPVTADDFKGLRFRTAGLSLEVMQELGAKPVAMSADKVADAIRRGELDASDFSNLTSDRNVGLNKVAPICLVQSYSKASGCHEIIFNSSVWASLSKEQTAMIEAAADAVSTEQYLAIAAKNAKDMAEMKAEGIRFIHTPTAILEAQINTIDRVMARHAQTDPLFDAILKSQKAFAKRVAHWQSDVEVSYELAASHYFGKQAIQAV